MLRHLEGAQRRAAAPSPRKEPVEVVRASDQVASRGGPTFGGFPGTTNWEETLGQTHNSRERLHISSGLGTPRDPPGGAGKRTQPAVAVT